MKKFAISDIHGCLKTFKQLLVTIQFTKEDELYLLGDYIDRGPDSKGVIDFIWQLQEEGYTVKCIRGNHEQLLIDGIEEADKFALWERNGALPTLESFGINNPANFPENYLNWFKQLPYYLEVDNYILVHAGFRFSLPNPFEEKKAMIWQRDWYSKINYGWLNGRIIVHGHTPITQNEISTMNRYKRNRLVVDIDNGCVFNNSTRRGIGSLCALELTDSTLYFQENID